MTLDQFINTHNGQPVDVDKEFGPQCWDLVELYAEQVLGVPRDPWAITLGPRGSAREAWTVFDGHMQRYFDKLPGSEKQKGDILVYGYAPDGHIAISLGGQQVFQENSPIGSAAHIGVNSDAGLLGVLRRKGQPDMADLPNDGDIINWKRFQTRNPNFQPEGKDFDFYKDPAHGWRRLAEDARGQLEGYIGKLESGTEPTTVLKPGKYEVK